MKKLALIGVPAFLLALVPASAAAQQQQVSVTMNAMAGSGVTGTAQLTAQGNQTQLVVNVQGAPPNGTHVNHIHTGSCAQIGGVVYSLTDLRVDATGRASATTLVNASLATIQGGSHFIMAHAGPALPSPGISCGDIPMLASAAAGGAAQRAPAQLPRTGEADFGLYGLGALGPLLAFAGVRLALRRRSI